MLRSLRSAAFAFLLSVTALLVTVLLVSFLPAMNYYKYGHIRMEAKDGAKVHRVAMTPLTQRKEPPRREKPLQQTAKKSLEPGKAVARQRFAMDLGVGAGGGGAGGVAVSGSDMEQVSYEEGETDVSARPLRTPAPRLPKQAEAAGAGGLVRCRLTIGENGKVVDVQFLEAPAGFGFEEAVREAVSQWEFQPASVGGVPVRQRMEQDFKF